MKKSEANNVDLLTRGKDPFSGAVDESDSNFNSLLQEASTGNAIAIECLLRRYSPQLLNALSTLVQSNAAAELALIDAWTDFFSHTKPEVVLTESQLLMSIYDRALGTQPIKEGLGSEQFSSEQLPSIILDISDNEIKFGPAVRSGEGVIAETVNKLTQHLPRQYRELIALKCHLSMSVADVEAVLGLMPGEGQILYRQARKALVNSVERALNLDLKFRQRQTMTLDSLVTGVFARL